MQNKVGRGTQEKKKKNVGTQNKKKLIFDFFPLPSRDHPSYTTRFIMAAKRPSDAELTQKVC
jgi:hypothetical protein